MEIIEFVPYRFFLIFDDGNYILDVSCSHSIVDYSWPIELNKREIENYKNEGKDYLVKLAEDIQYSAPGVVGNTSKYEARKISKELEEKVRNVVIERFNGNKK
jgi:hypothetical protein